MNTQPQLSLRSEAASLTAKALSKRLGEPIVKVVERALRELDERTRDVQPPRPDVWALLEKEMAEGAALAAERGQATSNHDDLYDKDGLPR